MSDFHVISSCAVCRRVRDDHWHGTHAQQWCSLVEFLRRRQTGTDDVVLSECYCPDCTLSYDRLIQYGQASLDAPI